VGVTVGVLVGALVGVAVGLLPCELTASAPHPARASSVTSIISAGARESQRDSIIEKPSFNEKKQSQKQLLFS
jgi:hypothetical protein